MGHGYHGPSALCNVGRRSLTPALPPRPESEYPKERRSSDAAAVSQILDTRAAKLTEDSGKARARPSRPWRKSQDEVRSEVEAAEKILLEGAASAAAAGIDAKALRAFFLAQDTLEGSSIKGQQREEVQIALDHLRQAATNAAIPEETNGALQAALKALSSAGLQVCTSHPRQDVCHQVLPALLLGGWAALGKDCGELRKRHVTHVVSIISADQRRLPEFIRGHLHIHSFDSEDAAQKLGERFPEICRFIDAARNEPRGVVYVHCGAGISRAPTATASYVMWKFGVPAAVAIRLIRAARPCIRPNVGFARELRQWEQRMHDVEGYASGAGSLRIG
ncbi:unnamed protein product [Cladocopium goreaui]|uniref:Probable dual specificity protein phosphatase DDB_G0269404 n=1 Tax=Cladocopium goreaui TaxID=2562237 RepID=A0A9P1CWL8_9DINO|nr:unnamed protein product [Cladocopium goreaui]